MCLRLDGDAAEGTDAVWVFRTDSATPESLSPEKLAELTPEYIQGCMNIIGFTLSPDGRYAAVLADKYPDIVSLLIVRLEDMAALTAEAALLEQVSPRDVLRYRDLYLMSWSENGLLVAVSDGMLFQVKAE